MTNGIAAGFAAIILILVTTFAIVPTMQDATGYTVFGWGFTVLMVLLAAVILVAMIVSAFRSD